MRGVLSGRDASGSTGTLHARGRARVTRLSLPGRTVIRKEFLGPDAERRMRRELAMLELLRGLAGVAQLVDEPWFPGSISLADAGGSRLADLPTPLDVDLLVRLGSALARTVAEMHRRGVLHRDVSPANIVVSPDGEPCLVGFGLATSLAEIRPEFTHHTEIVGTLAHLAPEQTGRTGRSVDQRADLYALGATLYELATGGPPFGSGDPLQLTHDHLARIPTPPAEVNPAVPAALSQIIVHLLEKEPDRRYQSAEGVVHDLEELAADPGRTLPIGEHDLPLRLLPPSRLVGRDAETAELHAAFTEALSGTCPGVLVAGAPGGRPRWSTSCGRSSRTPTGGSWPARSTSTGGTSTSTRSTRRCRRWGGCCWPNRRPIWRRSGTRSSRPWARTRRCSPRACRSSRPCCGCRPTRVIR